MVTERMKTKKRTGDTTKETAAIILHVGIYLNKDIAHAADRLQKLGFRVNLSPVEFINYCVLEMCGHEVFRCNIQNLRFNMSYSLDPVCQRAVNAVVESSTKFLRARTYLWFWTLIEGQIITRNKYGPQDYWPGDSKLKTYANCMNCINCCGILAFKK